MRKPKLLPAVALAAAALVLPALAAAQVKTVDKLKFPPLPDTELPQPTRVVLDNGMVVILVEDHELPLIDAGIRVHTGGRLESADTIGLAALVGSVMRSGGTATMTGDELDDWLEGRAAVIETSIGDQFGSATMSCLKQDFSKVLEVFADVLRQPAFDQDKIDVAKNQANSAISRQNDNPQQILFREFSEIIYGEDSPYAWSSTYATVGGITRDDMVAWHRRYFHPNRVILGLSGDFDTQQALAEVKRVFGGWQKGPAPERVAVPYKKRTDPGIYYVEKNDMTQSNIAMGHLGIQRDNPDYLAVEVLNEILSGSFASRLFSNVRSRKGLAYSVSGGVGSDWDHEGSFIMWMTTKTETTGAGIDALIEEARNITAKPPTDEEVAKAKAAILNSFVFRFDSTRDILFQQLTYEYYGFPLDWMQRYRQGIEKVTTAEVRQVAAKYVHPDQFAILVVGPAEGRDRPLSDYGQVTAVDITIPEPETRRVAATDESRKKGKTLITRAVEAMGGAAAVDAVDSIRQTGAVVAVTPQGEMSISFTSLLDYPDRFLQELSMPFGKMTFVITPEAAFLVSPQGTNDMPDSQRASQEKGIRRTPLYLLKARGESDFEAVAAGTGEVDGTPVELVQIELADDVITLGIEPGTGRILQIAYQGQDFTGAVGAVVDTYSDFRQVDGSLTLAFASRRTHNGAPLAQQTTESFVLNGKVDPDSFKKPEAQTAQN